MATGNAIESDQSDHLQHNTAKVLVLYREEVQTFTVISKDKPVVVEECHVVVQRVEGEKHEMAIIKQKNKVLCLV